MAAYNIGFVYVLSNASMPGLIKIGHTGLLADDRSRKLFTTGVPEPFTVEFRLTTSEPAAVEREAHRLLDPYRHRRDREFFKVPTPDAIDGVQRAALAANGISSWSGDRIHHIGPRDRVTARLLAGQLLVVLRYPDLFAIEADVIDIWQGHADGDYIEMYGTNDRGMVAGLSDNDPYGEVDPVPHLGRSATALNVDINGRERLVPGDRLLWIDRSDGTGEHSSTIFEVTSYCQVVGRTYQPQSLEGFPLLLNVLAEDPPATMVDVARRSLSLPRPRSWAPSGDADPDTWSPIGASPTQPWHWLPQLREPRNRRR